jgi:hypothetical protein
MVDKLPSPQAVTTKHESSSFEIINQRGLLDKILKYEIF